MNGSRHCRRYPVIRAITAILILPSLHVTGFFLGDPNGITTTRSYRRRKDASCLHVAQVPKDHHRHEASGQANQHQHRQVKREDRMVILEALDTARTPAQNVEFQSLKFQQQNFEEQYDPSTFDDQHIAFKLQHNQAFSSLARYCCAGSDTTNSDPKVFFLEGPDGATTQSLQRSGIRVMDCYVANRHESTCKTLESIYPDLNVLHTSAARAFDDTMSKSFAGVDFCAYYFDGCGGHVPHLVEMMTAALGVVVSPVAPLTNEHRRIAVGFSLLGDTRNMVEKDLAVSRAITKLARARRLRTRQILDEPERYGIPANISKTQGNILTSWILLE